MPGLKGQTHRRPLFSAEGKQKLFVPEGGNSQAPAHLWADTGSSFGGGLVRQVRHWESSGSWDHWGNAHQGSGCPPSPTQLEHSSLQLTQTLSRDDQGGDTTMAASEGRRVWRHNAVPHLSSTA